MSREYQICIRCIMDTTDPVIEFGENGVCDHCKLYYRLVKEHCFTGELGRRKLNEIVERIKEQGKKREYDCVIGLSGGVDSTYVAYLAKQIGLRPLAIHLDNGWNSEIAESNIKHIVKKLGIDLYTYTIDWNEFKDLQLAYLNASVVDIEAITDHGIMALFYKVASERGIKYILIGSNTTTEGISPRNWAYNKNDLINIKDIHKKFGKIKLRTVPTLGLLKQIYYQHIKGIKIIPILNYVPYIKRDVKKLMTEELDWEDYGIKHYESIFTRFYQAYILPRKFNIDKRKSHLSSLICAGQITRDEALAEIKKDLYDNEALKKDKEYVLEKLGLTDEEFERIMKLPIRSHYDYKTDAKWVRLVSLGSRILRR